MRGSMDISPRRTKLCGIGTSHENLPVILINPNVLQKTRFHSVCSSIRENPRLVYYEVTWNPMVIPALRVGSWQELYDA